MIIKEYKNLAERIKAKERDVELELDTERLQQLFELKFHDDHNLTSAVIFKDEISPEKMEVKEIPRTIEILYEASKIPSLDYYPVLEDSSEEESSPKSLRKRRSSEIEWSDSYGSSLDPFYGK
jgi:hypothetical protein